MLAAGVAVGWLLHDPARMVPVLVSVLVVTCPCALSLATPAAMTAALGALARAGLVATRANAVERLALATHSLADKTGTLTEGRFRLRSISPLAGVPESRCLALAAALERYAAHPVASAIAAAAADGPGEREAVVAPSPGPAGVAQTTPGPADCCSGSETGAAGPEARGGGPEARTSGPEAVCTNPVVEDASADTGGVTGRIGGVLYAVGGADYVARACGLVPGVPGVNAGDDQAPPLAVGEAASGSVERPNTLSRAGVRELAPSGDGPDAKLDGGRGGQDGGNGGNGRGSDGARSDEDDGGATHVFLARENTLLARFTLADTLHTGANARVEGLLPGADRG